MTSKLPENFEDSYHSKNEEIIKKENYPFLNFIRKKENYSFLNKIKPKIPRKLTPEEQRLVLETLSQLARERAGLQGTLAPQVEREKAPQSETLSVAEQRWDLKETPCTTDIVYDMVANTYSYLQAGRYQEAAKQLQILKGVDLPKYLDGDEKAQEVARRAISDLEKKI